MVGLLFLLPALYTTYLYYKKSKKHSFKKYRLYLICWIMIAILSIPTIVCFFLTKGLDMYKFFELLLSSFVVAGLIPLPCGMHYFNKKNVKPYRNMIFASLSFGFLYLALGVYFNMTY